MGGRLLRLLRALARGSTAADAPDGARARAAAALDAEAARVERLAADVRRRADALRGAVERQSAAEAARIDDLASLAAVPAARLRSQLLVLDGPASRRVEIARHVVGRDVALALRPWLGVTCCATATPAVRELWAQLLDTEAACDDALRGGPGTVLELADGFVWRDTRLHLSLTAPGAADGGARLVDAAIVPRCAYDFPARKLRNFGHWLMDCVPHLLALSALEPTGRFLLPAPYRDAHWAALALAGISRDRVMVWDGSPVRARRLLVEEADGRVARGRPLPLLLDLRQRILGAHPPRSTSGRRLYVSRRDAKEHRQWMSNHDEVEALFRRRGFEVLVMRDRTLDEQVALFREAQVVAGVSGAGLTNILFAAPGTHVVTLLTDSLMRWYAEEQGSRSTWASGRLPAGASLNELSDSPRFYAHLAAACEQTCHTFVCEDAVPVDRLEPFLDAVLPDGTLDGVPERA